MKKGKVFAVINLQEQFPCLYDEILENIDFETEQKLGNKALLITMHGEKDRPKVLKYTHNYQKVMEDVFSTLEVWSYMEDHNEEVDAYLDEHPELDFDKLCDLIEEALKNDTEVQDRISGVMINFNYYEMDEEFEDVVINHLPEKQSISRDENER